MSVICGNTGNRQEIECINCDCEKAVASSGNSEMLSAREIDLLNDMIVVQLNHASRCDAISNRVMAEKQKAWDMERVTVLQKILRVMGGQHMDIKPSGK